jgi:hypothetical protein
MSTEAESAFDSDDSTDSLMNSTKLPTDYELHALILVSSSKEGENEAETSTTSRPLRLIEGYRVYQIHYRDQVREEATSTQKTARNVPG